MNHCLKMAVKNMFHFPFYYLVNSLACRNISFSHFPFPCLIQEHAEAAISYTMEVILCWQKHGHFICDNMHKLCIVILFFELASWF